MVKNSLHLKRERMLGLLHHIYHGYLAVINRKRQPAKIYFIFGRQPATN